ncbi:hypothetical protein BpHYR1_002811 [Brachionus plicatilis]|uniref:Uncharacterized protein n=1 Tax=Brachionus plicatilis TaxID=10195 RepID=A0A3M7PR61_BRAPC|nr:hypothetical protein BpHYR1_002811 [Brachionus plicatilis]
MPSKPHLITKRLLLIKGIIVEFFLQESSNGVLIFIVFKYTIYLLCFIFYSNNLSASNINFTQYLSLVGTDQKTFRLSNQKHNRGWNNADLKSNNDLITLLIKLNLLSVLTCLRILLKYCTKNVRKYINFVFLAVTSSGPYKIGINEYLLFLSYYFPSKKIRLAKKLVCVVYILNLNFFYDHYPLIYFTSINK